ncbi:hypothetical protein PENSPDRAFT_590276, partial [Peniophora sp. CONT]
LVLILDVKTRWSSTHQMLRRILDYKGVVNNYVDAHDELAHLHMTKADWDAISTITRWLAAFRTATTAMSATKRPMLSSVHATFRDLQDDLKDSIRSLPEASSQPDFVRLRTALVDAHLKLSSYYWKFDQSPYYIWASHTASSSSVPTTKQYGSRYSRKGNAVIDELDMYFALPRSDWDTCNPLNWWHDRRGDFPNLSRLARDILCIPGTRAVPFVATQILIFISGSAVAVERIFSGGRDTVSLRRSSLSAETIRALMVVKYRLRAARLALEKLE